MNFSKTKEEILSKFAEPAKQTELLGFEVIWQKAPSFKESSYPIVWLVR